MAAINDWIKVEKSTARKPEVLMLAGILGIHPDHAFGLCVRFWFWVDDQISSRNCRAIVAQTARQKGDEMSRFCRAFVALDSVIGHDGFGAAMVEIGWLEVEESEHGVEIVIPNVDRHLSKTAKNRAENTSRQRLSRVAQMSRKCRAKSATRERDRERVEEEEPPRGPPKNSPLKIGDEDTIESPPIADLVPKSDALPISDVATPIDDFGDKRPKTLPNGQNAAESILCNPVTNGINTASTVGELVSLWCHFCRRPGNSAQRALPVLDELVRQGISIESIRLAIIDPARDRTEAIWTFCDRLTAVRKPAAAPTDFGAEVAAMIRQNQAAKRAST